MADVYLSRGEWQKALEMYDLCLQRLRQSSENKNLDLSRIPMSIAVYTMRRGVALDSGGRTAEGLANLERGLSLYRDFLNGQGSDFGQLSYAPEFLRIAVDFYARRKQQRRAADVWQDYIERLEPFLRRSPNDGGILLNMAAGFEAKGDVLGGFRDGDFTETNPQFLREAKEDYERGLAVIRKDPEAGEPTFGTLQRIKSLEGKIAILRSRT
jgi:tetratricopeptide (TPR) repeat protein